MSTTEEHQPLQHDTGEEESSACADQIRKVTGPAAQQSLTVQCNALKRFETWHRGCAHTTTT